jgi:2-polyprenyl-3-methyl-5-hydroxy-6-metoxy-1,4-benzoquinol methylase
MAEWKYVGSELDLFTAVRHWKAYWSGEIRPFVKGDVLEVGAGIGSNTRYLDRGDLKRYVCLEPDRELVERLTAQLGCRSPRRYEVICGTLESLSAGDRFDTIVYIDVLEHIEDDQAELRKAAARLRPGGRLIVLSPAHQWLYTPFDKALGHCRRYTRAMLRAISPPQSELMRCRYLDSVGVLASAANRFLLRQPMPSKAQLQFWDTFLVPCSRLADRCLMHSAGKTIVAIWRRAA